MTPSERRRVVAEIEQRAWDSETIRFRASKREAFRAVLRKAFDAGTKANLQKERTKESIETPRTKAKIRENLGLLVAYLEKEYARPVSEATQTILFNALDWTADDVARQRRGQPGGKK